MRFSLIVYIFVFAATTFFTESFASFTNGKSERPKIQVGEELVYVVKYSVLKLGELRFKIIDETEIKGKIYYRAVCYIDSYPSIPFVDLHQVYETKMNENFFSSYFKGIVKDDKFNSFTEYFFNYENKSIRVLKGNLDSKEIWTDTTGTVNKQYQDGLSLFYFARMNAGKDKKISLPCMVNEKEAITNINFYSDVRKLSIDIFDYDLETFYLNGSTDFISIFGLTGNFEGWFTNDEAAIPVKAKMKVLIGNIDVELIKWKREGWIPPKYKL